MRESHRNMSTTRSRAHIWHSLQGVHPLNSPETRSHDHLLFLLPTSCLLRWIHISLCEMQLVYKDGWNPTAIRPNLMKEEKFSQKLLTSKFIHKECTGWNVAEVYKCQPVLYQKSLVFLHRPEWASAVTKFLPWTPWSHYCSWVFFISLFWQVPLHPTAIWKLLLYQGSVLTAFNSCH